MLLCNNKYDNETNKISRVNFSSYCIYLILFTKIWADRKDRYIVVIIEIENQVNSRKCSDNTNNDELNKQLIIDIAQLAV